MDWADYFYCFIQKGSKMIRQGEFVFVDYNKNNGEQIKRLIQVSKDWDGTENLQGLDLEHGGIKSFIPTGINNLQVVTEKREVMPKWAYCMLDERGWDQDAYYWRYDDVSGEAITYFKKERQAYMEVGTNLLRLYAGDGTQADLVLMGGNRVLFNGTEYTCPASLTSAISLFLDPIAVL